MRNSFKLTITREHIRTGKLSCTLCPIAHAIKERFPKEFVFVGTCSVDIGGIEYVLSRRAKTFIRKFDRGMDVSSQTIILKKASHSINV